MDAAKWSQENHQEIGLMKPMEEIVSSNSGGTCTAGRPVMERKARPPEQLNCPRCNSTNTKFCYYNNYSLTQPRYFCKSCRRYWTEGGSLRNVPVGGGSRKNKRSSVSSSTTTTTSQQHAPRVIPDLNPPNKGQDLNLAFPAMLETHQAMAHFLQAPKSENINGSSHHHHQDQDNSNNNQVSSSSSPAQSVPNYDHHSSQFSALELLRTGLATRGLSSFVTGPVMDHHSSALYSSGFPMHDYKPNLGFTIDNGLGNRAAAAMNHHHHHHQDNNNNGGGGGGRINFFPFGEMKQINSGTSNNEVDDQGSKGQQGNSSTAGGYWSNNGVLGGGPW